MKRRIGRPWDQKFLDLLRSRPDVWPEGAAYFRGQGDYLAARAAEKGRITDLLILRMLIGLSGRPTISRN
jgi:hypothetical protein